MVKYNESGKHLLKNLEILNKLNMKVGWKDKRYSKNNLSFSQLGYLLSVNTKYRSHTWNILNLASQNIDVQNKLRGQAVSLAKNLCNNDIDIAINRFMGLGKAVVVQTMSQIKTPPLKDSTIRAKQRNKKIKYKNNITMATGKLAKGLEAWRD